MKHWTMILVGLLLTGCIIIPTGEMRRDAASRRPISDERVRSLQPGSATRVDVLLSMGAPETSLEAEAYFIYQWSTKSGFLGTEGGSGPLNTSHHDLLFEFDNAGRLVQSGDLKTLLQDGLGRDKPPAPAAPSAIPILSSWVERNGRLILNRNELQLEYSGEEAQDFAIPPGGALVLDYRTSREGSTRGAWRRYDLKFRDASGEVHEVGIQIDVASLIPLARYLHQHSPEIRIYD